eukprot:6334982-Pyramimonas_sp.AAC.2
MSLVFMFVLLCHWIACAWFYIGITGDADPDPKYDEHDNRQFTSWTDAANLDEDSSFYTVRLTPPSASAIVLIIR